MCAPCIAAANAAKEINVNSYRKVKEKIENCLIDKELLTKWKSVLKCIKLNNRYTEANITISELNSSLGYIQSALNYPDDYCYYTEELNNFKNNILPRIVENVPSCIN